MENQSQNQKKSFFLLPFYEKRHKVEALNISLLDPDGDIANERQIVNGTDDYFWPYLNNIYHLSSEDDSFITSKYSSLMVEDNSVDETSAISWTLFCLKTNLSILFRPVRIDIIEDDQYMYFPLAAYQHIANGEISYFIDEKYIDEINSLIDNKTINFKKVRIFSSDKYLQNIKKTRSISYRWLSSVIEEILPFFTKILFVEGIINSLNSVSRVDFKEKFELYAQFDNIINEGTGKLSLDFDYYFFIIFNTLDNLIRTLWDRNYVRLDNLEIVTNWALSNEIDKDIGNVIYNLKSVGLRPIKRTDEDLTVSIPRKLFKPTLNFSSFYYPCSDREKTFLNFLTDREAMRVKENLTDREAMRVKENLTDREAMRVKENLTDREAIRVKENLTDREALRVKENLTDREAMRERNFIDFKNYSNNPMTLPLKRKIIKGFQETYVGFSGVEFTRIYVQTPNFLSFLSLSEKRDKIILSFLLKKETRELEQKTRGKSKQHFYIEYFFHSYKELTPIKIVSLAIKGVYYYQALDRPRKINSFIVPLVDDYETEIVELIRQKKPLFTREKILEFILSEEIKIN